MKIKNRIEIEQKMLIIKSVLEWKLVRGYKEINKNIFDLQEIVTIRLVVVLLEVNQEEKIMCYLVFVIISIVLVYLNKKI